ncbi:MAG TPA: ATPase domain-containing protein [Polyangiales bacterium]
MTVEAMSRVPTGIDGLDTILEGGLLRGGVYIIEGPPGVGKTTLGSHFCFNHAASGGRAVYITLLAESHTRLLGHLRRMRFFEPSLVPERVSYVSAFKVLEAEGLGSLLKLVRQTVAAQKATVVVLDGLVSAEEASPTAKDFKKFIHELQVVTAMVGCTALLLNSTERPRGFRPERTMVDGIIELEDELVKLRAIRHLSVRKMRGAAPVRGKHVMTISDDGVAVVPRIETHRVETRRDVEIPIGRPRVNFGVTQLDAMMLGGVCEGSITAVVGPSGAGKTILGLHFLHAGLERGERGLYFGCFERPHVIVDKAKKLSLALDTPLLAVEWQRPVEGVIDLLADQLLRTVRQHGPRRVFIDGLQGFHAAAESPERLREVMSCLSEELEDLGVTAAYSAETPDLFGENLQLSISGMSSLTHNIVLLNHVERPKTTRRTLTVLKVRDAQHDLSVRDFAITTRGFVVSEPDPDSAVGATPRSKVPTPTKRRKLPASTPKQASKKRQRRA